MRRYQSLPFLASVFLPRILAGPGQNLDAICKSTEGTYGCEEYFQIPYGSEPITTCFDTSPCGVQILTNNRNICDIIEDAMGNDGFVVGYPAYCREAPRAIKEVKTERAVWVDGKLKGAKWIALATANSAEEVGLPPSSSHLMHTKATNRNSPIVASNMGTPRVLFFPTNLLTKMDG